MLGGYTLTGSESCTHGMLDVLDVDISHKIKRPDASARCEEMR